MAKSVTPTDPFSAAMAKVSEATAALAEAQAALDQANQELEAQLEALPTDHALRVWAASKVKASGASNGKPKAPGTRTRATEAELEALKGEVLAKLLKAGGKGLAMGELNKGLEGSAKTRLENLVRGLPKSGEAVTTGIKKSARYFHPSHAPKGAK